eukprot:622500-Karenia_brevis.AAC.1
MEIATRRFHKVLQDNYWRTTFVPNKYRGPISVDYKAIVKIIVDDEGVEPILLWKQGMVQQHNLDKDWIKAKFLQSITSKQEDDGLWCP